MVSNEALSCNWKIPTAERLLSQPQSWQRFPCTERKWECEVSQGRMKPYFFPAWYYAGLKKMSSKKSLARTSGFCCWCKSQELGLRQDLSVISRVPSSDEIHCHLWGASLSAPHLGPKVELHMVPVLRESSCPLTEACAIHRLQIRWKKFAWECWFYGELTHPKRITTEYKSEYVWAGPTPLKTPSLSTSQGNPLILVSIPTSTMSPPQLITCVCIYMYTYFF